MYIWTLKLVMLLMFEETVRVRVAAVDCPGWSTMPCWFHVMVIGPFAVVGLQLFVVMPKVSERPLLVFFM